MYNIAVKKRTFLILRGKAMGDWFANESFWKTMYNSMFPEESFTQAPEEVKQFLSLINFKGSSVLDLCCGPGRHSIALAKKGFHVTAVDMSPFLLGNAMAAAKAENINVEWIREDMRKFSRPEAFDLIINLFTSFGYFEEEKDNEAVLSLMYANLKNGGMVVMDTIAKEILARIYQPTQSTELPDGSIIVRRVKINEEWSRCQSQWVLIKDRSAESYSFSHTIYSGIELKTLLLNAGFNNVKLYGNLEGNAYDPQASRLIAVAYK
jgi:2-polyprenyl-3-methyl-5-hydroxy-6-metoxy-1,4-benzoquinol methylase